MRILKYISIFSLVLVLFVFVYNNSPRYQIIKGEIFGTFYSIKIRTDKHDKSLKSDIKQKLNEINSQMSVFNENSEINKINNAPTNKYIQISSDMSNVLKASHGVWLKSGGFFDPTLGKIIDIWGFGTAENTNSESINLKKVMQGVGMNKLKFSSNFQKVKKTNSQTKLNLSAIAKGYAVDEISALLDMKGYNNYVVEIGGEIKTKGVRAEPDIAWNIGINKPQSENGDNSLVLSLSNIAVATSGNYRNFYKKNGRTYAHTISHQTGQPVESDILSVSVFHNSCMYADAYATAILAMGLTKGIKFADKNKLKVIIFDNKMNKLYSDEAKKSFSE